MPSRRHHRLNPVVLAAALALEFGACTVGVEIGSNEVAERSVVLDVPARKRSRLDLLFVIDSSSNMQLRQERLASSFEYLIDALRGVRGSLPDLHVGVVSSDLGAGSFAPAQSRCTASGGGGALVIPPACSSINGSFLNVSVDSTGLAIQNFAGSLEDAFSCMTALGESGCDYEQPMEAMRRALTGSLNSSIPTNRGFLRQSAMLGVVFVTDEDDCSARGDAIFNPDAMLSGDPEWRCFSSGVRCGDADDVFPPGLQSDCVAREDSRYVTGIDEFSQFLSDIKSNPDDVVVSGVIGDPDLVRVVAAAPSTLGIEPACRDASGEEVFPSVRLGRLIERTRGSVQSSYEHYKSLCDRTEAGILNETANNLRQAMGSTCLQGRIVDMDGDTPGPQIDCVVSEVVGEREQPITACDNRFAPTDSSAFPCYTIEPGNDACSHEPTRLSLRVVRSRAPDPHGLDAAIDARLRASCVVDSEPVPID